MAEKRFLSWLGYKDEHTSASESSPLITKSERNSEASSPIKATTNSSSIDRLRELEAEIADLRARRDITSLTREEFEILATETATTLIKTAQAREHRAITAAERALSEANQAAKALTESAELKARTTLQNAESRGRKYIEEAEVQAKAAIERANATAQELLNSKQREATSITSSAKREAERLISEASLDITNFKNWLSEAISEAERLHKMQTQALAAAEEGIKSTRAKLATAFEKISTLGTAVDAALDEKNHPKDKDFLAPISTPKNSNDKVIEKTVKKSVAPHTPKQSTSSRKSVGRPPKRK